MAENIFLLDRLGNNLLVLDVLTKRETQLIARSKKIIFLLLLYTLIESESDLWIVLVMVATCCYTLLYALYSCPSLIF